MTAIKQQQAVDGDTIDLGEIFRIVLSNWALIIASILVALISAILYLREARSIYLVDGLIQIQNNQSASDALLSSTGLSNMADVKSSADTEIQLLKSRFVLSEVVRGLNLDIVLSSDHDRWYQRLINPTAPHLGYSKDGVSFAANHLAFTVNQFDVPYALLDKQFKLVFTDDGSYTLELLNNSGTADLQDGSSMTGRVGKLFTQSFGDGSIKLLIHKNNAAAGTVYLSKVSPLQAVQSINNNLSISEKGKQTGVMALTYQGVDPDYIQQTLNEVMRVYLAQNVASRTEESQRTLDFLTQQLPILKKELESSENKYNIFREKNNTIDPTKEAELLLQQSVDLKTKKMELEQQSVLLGQKYTSNFPLISQINAQVAAIDQNGKDLESRVTAMPEMQRQYLQLYRDVQVNTAIYTGLLNNYEQLKVLKAGKTATARILDQAIKSSEPIKPQKALVLLLSIMVGFIVSLLLILLKSIFYSGVKDSDHIEANTGLSVVATVPRSITQRKMFKKHSKRISLVAKDDVEDLAVESLKSLRTTLHFSLMQADNNIILITGPSPAIGKSFISANFATVCAQMGKTVVLVDADMRRGHLDKYFDLDKVKGLADYLKNETLSLEDVCLPTSINGLSFIAKGAAPVNPAELLLTERFNVLISQLSAQYDYVVIDSPPILAATDAAIMGRLAGVTLMVVRYGQTHMRELELSVSRLRQAGVTVSGVVFNDVQSAAGYGYQYAYQYRADK